MEEVHPPAAIDASPAAEAAATSSTAPPEKLRGLLPRFRRNEMWTYFGPAFVASVAYIDPGNFATNIEGGSRFGYRLLWVLLWSNAMAILIQYLSAKLGIVTGLTLPQNCRKHFSRRTAISLWIAAEIAAIATDLAEFLAPRWASTSSSAPFSSPAAGPTRGALFAAALVSTVLVFAILALDLAGYRWLERGVMAFVGIIGLCYGFEVFLVHPDWPRAAFHSLVPTLDTGSPAAFHESIYLAVSMLGATVMPHVVYLHSALVQPRLKELTVSDHLSAGTAGKENGPVQRVQRRFLHFELIDVFAAMNGAWLINSAMLIMAAVAFTHGIVVDDVEVAHHTLGPLLGPLAATAFAVALLCSGLSSSTVGVMAGQVIIEGFLDIKFPIFLRRLITIIPALVVIATGLKPLKIITLSQVILSFTLPAALIPLLILTSRASVMDTFRSANRTRIAGWTVVTVVVVLNAILLVQLAA